MTTPDLDLIKARAEAATPGPWEHVDRADPWGQPMTKDGLPSTFMGCGSVITLGEDVAGGDICAPNGDLYPRSGYSPGDDMAFIAAARTDIPALVAEVERLRAELDEARDAMLHADRALAEADEAVARWERVWPVVTAVVEAVKAWCDEPFGSDEMANRTAALVAARRDLDGVTNDA